MADKQDIPDDKKTIFDWCREGNIDKMKLLLKEIDCSIKDENVSDSLIAELYMNHMYHYVCVYHCRK